jgi:two-component system sensor histidine kinase/response regulator
MGRNGRVRLVDSITMSHTKRVIPRILVVDDRKENLLAFSAVFSGLDYEIVEAQSGKEALRLLLHQEFSLILLDVNMPEIDGFETARLIRQRKAPAVLPILFISAREPDEEDRRQAFSLGAIDYIGKPIIPEVLRGKVSALLDLQSRAESLEAAVRQRTQELEDLNLRAEKLRGTVAELEAFSYSLSHDMKGPLRAMQSYSKILEADFADKLPDEAKSMVRRIGSAANRLEKMVADVLAYSRMTLEPISKKAVEMEALIGGIIEHDSHLQPPEATIRIEGPLPSVIGHPASLVQCVSNLLYNAVKFVAPGVQPQVTIRAQEVEGSIRFWFEDNGIGIASGARLSIFEPFQRLHSEKQYEGTGLGLTIVRKAVEKMGGQFGVESEQGKGSRFWIQLAKGEMRTDS